MSGAHSVQVCNAVTAYGGHYIYRQVFLTYSDANAVANTLSQEPTVQPGQVAELPQASEALCAVLQTSPHSPAKLIGACAKTLNCADQPAEVKYLFEPSFHKRAKLVMDLPNAMHCPSAAVLTGTPAPHRSCHHPVSRPRMRAQVCIWAHL